MLQEILVFSSEKVIIPFISLNRSLLKDMGLSRLPVISSCTTLPFPPAHKQISEKVTAKCKEKEGEMQWTFAWLY